MAYRRSGRRGRAGRRGRRMKGKRFKRRSGTRPVRIGYRM